MALLNHLGIWPAIGLQPHRQETFVLSKTRTWSNPPETSCDLPLALLPQLSGFNLREVH
jgi:hypothetical protein